MNDARILASFFYYSLCIAKQLQGSENNQNKGDCWELLLFETHPAYELHCAASITKLEMKIWLLASN